MARSDVGGPARELTRRVPPLPTLPDVDDSRLAQAHPGVLLPRLLAMARDRLEWASAELAAQIADEGLAGVVGRVHGVTPQGETVELREEVRALVALEAEERDRVATLAKDIARLGLDAEQSLRDVAQVVVGALRSVVRELGLEEQSEPVLRAMRRAGLAARQSAGHPEVNPNEVGPRLTPVEQAAVFRAALARAETAAAFAAETESIANGGRGGGR